MRFLEMTKFHLARQGSTMPNSRVLDNHAVKRVIGETENTVIFQDHEGRYWRNHKIYGQSWEAVVPNARKTIGPGNAGSCRHNCQTHHKPSKRAWLATIQFGREAGLLAKEISHGPKTFRDA
jgi:hypothetical protein